MDFISFVEFSLGAGLFLLAESLSAALRFLVLVMRRSQLVEMMLQHTLSPPPPPPPPQTGPWSLTVDGESQRIKASLVRRLKTESEVLSLATRTLPSCPGNVSVILARGQASSRTTTMLPG